MQEWKGKVEEELGEQVGEISRRRIVYLRKGTSRMSVGTRVGVMKVLRGILLILMQN